MKIGDRNFSNIHYKSGYAFYDGKAFGIGDFMLKAAAGYNQLTKPKSPSHGLINYFDDKRDHEMVNQGIQYWNNNFKNVK